MSDQMQGWEAKKSWRKWGKNFLVEVVGWDVGFKRWNIYVYIYPGHALFLECGPHSAMFDHPIAPLEGVSFFKLHRNDKGAVSSYQWGNDYDHIWNEGWDAEDKERAAKRHAQELYEWMLIVSRPHCEAERKPATQEEAP